MKRPFIFVSVITFLLQLCAAENYYVYNDNGKQGIDNSRIEKQSIDEYLIENGFKKVDGFAPSDYYIFNKSEENKFYIPFTYGEERMIDDQKVVVCYIFTEIGNEMINRYTSISFFDKDENRFVYEKENKTMDSGNRTMIWNGKVGHKGSIQYENPVLYLWE